jgi:hypothetical protein
VGGRDRTKLVESMDWQVRTVHRVVDKHLVEMDSVARRGRRSRRCASSTLFGVS